MAGCGLGRVFTFIDPVWSKNWSGGRTRSPGRSILLQRQSLANCSKVVSSISRRSAQNQCSELNREGAITPLDGHSAVHSENLICEIRIELWNRGTIAGNDCDRQTSNLGPTRLF